MLSIIRERFRQGHRTSKYPQEAPTLPARFRGRPVIEREKCPPGCQDCLERCPFGALTQDGSTVAIHGQTVRQVQLEPQACWGCGLCATTCPEAAISMRPL